MKILIVGGSGFLGRELAQQALATGHTVTATFATRAGNIPGIHWLPVDLRRSEEITPVLREIQPDVVINAAYRKADWATTADGAICLAMAAAQHGSRLVHVSSDAIFSGADVRYDESATPDPVTPYGAAKAAWTAAGRNAHCAPRCAAPGTSYVANTDSYRGWRRPWCWRAARSSSASVRLR
ncbi:sugar nucleotide-binding protein [Streptomyces sioyaensis]|uniref:sugar nucleotide-binding protein n=1 Tax=Streptomyces sioyaensis TaxID=67364 RepID=UPI0037CD1F7E